MSAHNAQIIFWLHFTLIYCIQSSSVYIFLALQVFWSAVGKDGSNFGGSLCQPWRTLVWVGTPSRTRWRRKPAVLCKLLVHLEVLPYYLTSFFLFPFFFLQLHLLQNWFCIICNCCFLYWHTNIYIFESNWVSTNFCLKKWMQKS